MSGKSRSSTADGESNCIGNASRHKDYHNRAESPYSNRRARSSDAHAYPPDSSSRRELAPYGARGGGGDRDMGYSDDENDEQARQRRKLERRAAKKRREAEEEERKAMQHAGRWGHILHL